MPVRSLVCAISILMIATPAAAGDRIGYSPQPHISNVAMQADTFSLLMLDEGVTHRSPATTIRLPATIGIEPVRAIAAAGPQSDDLDRFDALDLSNVGYLPVSGSPETRLAARFLFDGDRLGVNGWRLAAPQGLGEARLDPRNALNEARASLPRGVRRRSPLSASLEFRLDGRPDSPAFSLGGGAATVLNIVRPGR